MIYIYRADKSEGAKLIVEALNGIEPGSAVRARTPLEIGRRETSRVVCWGAADPRGANQPGKVLNGIPLRDKLEDAQVLRTAGVPTIEVALQRPRGVQPEAINTTIHNVEEANRLIAGLQDLIAAFNRPAVDWIPRALAHVDGDDLQNPPAQPGFWVRKEPIRREYRVHSFLGRSIRAGVKVPRPGMQAHPWIRAYSAGWQLDYCGVEQRFRDLAHQAVSALGLQFGAVDIGERPDGSLFVLEVNRAPGAGLGVIDAYARAITRWAEE